MSRVTRINSFATAIGNDIQTLLAQDGDLTALSTAAKGSLVEAINEIAAAAPSGTLLAASNLSDLVNSATARTNLDVRSTSQVTSEITAAIAAITLAGLGGLDQAAVDARVQLVVDTAPAALDTLNELAAALGDDPNFSATIATSLSNKVDFSAPQTKTAAEKQQASENIGMGDPEADFLTTYTVARDT